MLELYQTFFNLQLFIPQNHNYLEKPEFLTLYAGADLIIALAYYSVSILAVYFLAQRREISLKWVFLLLAAYIILCGTNHLLAVWALWYPVEHVSGIIKAVIALISVYIAVKIGENLPKVLALTSAVQLETIEQKLADEISDRQQAEAALKESEARFRSIFEGASMGIALVDKVGQLLEANPAFTKMIGYSADELQQKCFTEFTHPEYIDADRQLYQEMMARKRDSYAMEKRYICKDGKYIWGYLKVSLMHDAKGETPFAVATLEDITERKQAEAALQEYKEHLEELVGERTNELTKTNEKLSWQATHDSLTGLINRQEFERCLTEAVISAKTHNHEHSLCYLDLDQLKIVNDACGNLAGDELLYQISILMQSKCRKTDLLARIGGDEFVLLLYQCPLEQAIKVTQTLHESIQAFQFVWEDKIFSISASFGLIAVNSDSINTDSVMGAADAACLTAKNRGRNRIHIYQPDDQELAKQLSQVQWVTRINQAIAENHFRLYYQTIVPLNDENGGQHYELLLRLVDENGQIVPPMAFLPAAERYNLMPAIDRWVISTFFSELKQASGSDIAKLDNSNLYAINLSGATVNDDKFIDFLKQQFELYQIPPEIICFEITETFAIANLNQALQLLGEIKTLGCYFALDDFGSGMSSFGYLKYLPVDFLKIDGQFVKLMADDPIDYAMVETINRIGHIMGIKTIAEFVSDNIILEKLTAIGVDYAQGYGIAMPQPLEFKKNSECN